MKLRVSLIYICIAAGVAGAVAAAAPVAERDMLHRIWGFDWRPVPEQRKKAAFTVMVRPVEHGAIRRPEGEFGAVRRSGIRYHKGIDLIAPAGTPVRAAGSGFICYNEMNGGLNWGYGYTVLIDHMNDFYTLYAHLMGESPLPVGCWVRAGRQIGRVGRSGNAMQVPKEFQYQLHFEIIHAPSGLMDLGGLRITALLSPQPIIMLRQLGEAVYGPYWGGVMNPEELGTF